MALDASVSNGPNRWYLPASTITNAVLVAVGLLKLWNGGLQPDDTSDALVWALQFWRFVGVVVLARLALLLTQVYGLRFVTRARSRVASIGGVVTLALVWATAVVLALPAILPAATWPEWWWRLAAATTLVAAVAAVIPLIVRAFEAKPATGGDQQTGPELRPNPPFPLPQTGRSAQQGVVPPPQPYVHYQPPQPFVHNQPPQTGAQPEAIPPQPQPDSAPRLPQAQPAAVPPATNAPPPTTSGFAPPQ